MGQEFFLTEKPILLGNTLLGYIKYLKKPRMAPHNAIFWQLISNRGSLRKKKGIFMKNRIWKERKGDPPPQKKD